MVKRIHETERTEHSYHRYIDLEDAVIDEINAARVEPGYWVRHLEKMRLRFRGNKYTHKRFGPMVYPHGAALIDSAIEYVRSVRPVRMLERYEYLDRVARNEHGRTKTLESGIRMATLRSMHNRMRDITQGFGAYGEMFSFGFPDAVEIVKDLILEEVMSNPMHVNGIFSDRFSKIGIFTDMHSKTQLCTMVTFMGDTIGEPTFIDRGEPVLHESHVKPVEYVNEYVKVVRPEAELRPRLHASGYEEPHRVRIEQPVMHPIHSSYRVPEPMHMDRYPEPARYESRVVETHYHNGSGCNICHAPLRSRSYGRHVNY